MLFCRKVYDLRYDGLGMRRVAAASLPTTIQNAAVISRLDTCQRCRCDTVIWQYHCY